MVEAKQCERCDRYFNTLNAGLCQYCEADIDKTVLGWVPLLEASLVSLGRFDAEVRRLQAEGKVDAEDLPAPRRPRDLPGWITW